MFRTVLLAAILSSSTLAHAGFPGFNPNLPEGERDPTGLPVIEMPLITKSNGSGFVMMDWVRNETCEVYADRVVITKNFGVETVLTETRLINIAGDLVALVLKAALEPVTETENFLCDAPSTFIAAHANGEDVVLFSSGGCGSPGQVRNDATSMILRDIILSYCPNVHSFGL